MRPFAQLLDEVALAGILVAFRKNGQLAGDPFQLGGGPRWTEDRKIGGAQAVGEAIDQWRPTLDVPGTIAPCGSVGMGQVMKVANNAMAIGTWSLLMEVRELVQQQGMDLDQFMDILNQSSGRSFVSQNFPLPPQRVPLPAMARKDLGIFLDLATAGQTPAPMIDRCVEAGSS